MQINSRFCDTRRGNRLIIIPTRSTFSESAELAQKQELYHAKVEELLTFMEQRLEYLKSEWGQIQYE